MDTFPRALQNLMKERQMTTEALSDVTGISVSITPAQKARKKRGRVI